MKLAYKQTKVEDLKAGDIFVNSTPEEMDTLIENEVGIAIFLRTNAPLSNKIPMPQFAPVLRIDIKKDKKK